MCGLSVTEPIGSSFDCRVCASDSESLQAHLRFNRVICVACGEGIL